MPGPGRYVGDGKGGLKRAPGSRKGKKTQTVTGAWRTSPVGYSVASGGSAGSAGSGVAAGGSAGATAGSQGPSATQALANVRAKRGETSDTAPGGKKRKDARFVSSVTEIARQVAKVDPDVKAAHRRGDRRRADKQIAREFKSLLPSGHHAGRVSRLVSGQVDPDKRLKAEIVGETSRAEWGKRKDSPWKGVQSGEATVRKARKLAGAKAISGNKPENVRLWPNEYRAVKKWQAEQVRAGNRAYNETAGDRAKKLGKGIADIPVSMGKQWLRVSGSANRALNPLAKAPGGKDLAKLENKLGGGEASATDYLSAGVDVALAGAGGWVARGVKKGVGAARTAKLAKQGSKAFDDAMATRGVTQASLRRGTRSVAAGRKSVADDVARRKAARPDVGGDFKALQTEARKQGVPLHRADGSVRSGKALRSDLEAAARGVTGGSVKAGRQAARDMGRAARVKAGTSTVRREVKQGETFKQATERVAKELGVKKKARLENVGVGARKQVKVGRKSTSDLLDEIGLKVGRGLEGVSSGKVGRQAASDAILPKPYKQVRAFMRKPKVKRVKQGVVAGAIGADLVQGKNGRIVPFAQGNVDAIKADPKGFVGRGFLAAAQSAVIPLTLGLNALQGLHKGSTKPLEAAAKEMFEGTKGFFGDMASGDRERVRKLAEETGWLPMFTAYTLGRPATKGIVRDARKRVWLPDGPEFHGATRVSQKAKLAGKRVVGARPGRAGKAKDLKAEKRERLKGNPDAIVSDLDRVSWQELKDRRKAGHHARTASHAAKRGEQQLVRGMTGETVKARRKFNLWFVGSPTHRKFQRLMRDAGFGKNTHEIVTFAQFAVNELPKGFSAADVRKLVRDAPEGSVHQRYARVLLGLPELYGKGGRADKFRALQDALRKDAKQSPRKDAFPISRQVEQQTAAERAGLVEPMERPDVGVDTHWETRLNEAAGLDKQAAKVDRKIARLPGQKREAKQVVRERTSRANERQREHETAVREQNRVTDKHVSAAAAADGADLRVKQVNKEIRDLTRENAQLYTDQWHGGRVYGRGRARTVSNRERARQGRKPVHPRQEAQALKEKHLGKRDRKIRQVEIQGRLKELHKQREALLKVKHDAAAANRRLTDARNRVRKAARKETTAFKQVQKATVKLDKLKRRKDELSKQKAALLERSEAIKTEASFRLSKKERAQVAAEVKAKHPHLERDPSKAIDIMDGKIASLQTRIDSLNVRASTLKGREQARAAVELERLVGEQGELINLRGEMELLATKDYLKALVGAEIVKREMKRKAVRDQPVFQMLFHRWQQNIRIAEQAGYVDPVYVPHREFVPEGVRSGSPSFGGGLGSPKEHLRTGAMVRAGENAYSNKVFMDHIHGEASRQANMQVTSYLFAKAAFEHKGKLGNQNTFTLREIRGLEAAGERLNGYVRLPLRLMTTPEGWSAFMERSRKGGLNSKTADSVLGELIGETVERNSKVDVEATAQRMAQKGEGERYVLVQERALKEVFATEKALESTGVTQVLSAVNALPSRLLLGTSLSWLFNQVIAEMLPLVSSHNPARLVKAISQWHEIHKDPEAMRSLRMFAGNNFGTDLRLNYGSHQNAMQLFRKTLPGMMVTDLANLRTLGKIDRFRGGWYREIGAIAELDRELSSVRRMSKAIRGLTDDIEMVSGKLKGLSQADQWKFLRSPEGIAAGNRIARNVDAHLGNWTDLRTWEQNLSGPIIFYPFVRYSINWTFRTFPKRHPVRAAIMQAVGANNEALVEREFGKPTWVTDWLRIPLYDKDGELVGAAPVNRISNSSNAFSDLLGDRAGEGQVPFIWGVTQALNPAVSTPIRAVAGKDGFGRNIEDVPSLKAAGAILADSVMNLSPLSREKVVREKGFDPIKGVRNEESWFGHKKPVRPGDRRGPASRLLFAGVDRKADLKARFESQQIDNRFYGASYVDSAYPKLKDPKTGREVSVTQIKEDVEKREREFTRSNPGKTVPARSAQEKRAFKLWADKRGEIAEADVLKLQAVRDRLKLNERWGAELPRKMREFIVEQRQEKRSKLGSTAPSYFKNIPARRREHWTQDEWVPYARTVGKLPLDVKQRKFESGRESYKSLVDGEAPAASFTAKSVRGVKGADARIVAEKASRFSPGKIKKWRRLPHGRKVRFAGRVLDAKAAFEASKGGSVKGLPEGKQWLGKLYSKYAKKHGLGAEGALILAGINEAETSFGDNLSTSSAGAQGWMQFMPGTWAEYGKGDPNKPENAIDAAARYLKASGGPDDWDKAIFAYNHADWYVRMVKENAAKYKLGSGNKKGDPKLKQKWLNMEAVGNAMGVYEGGGGTPGGPVKFTNADMSGVGTPVRKLGKYLARSIGESELSILSGKANHSKYTVNGNVSEHYAGNALDISALMDGYGDGDKKSQARGDKIAVNAIVALGGSRKEANEFIKNGRGLFNAPGGQVIWGQNSPAVGGNHLDHVHVSAHKVDPSWLPGKKGGTTDKLSGPWEGSRAMVRKITGMPTIRGDHAPVPGKGGRADEAGVHSGYYHNNADSYAQDINSNPGYFENEGEPPYTQETLDKIVKNLRGMGAEVPDLKIGENPGPIKVGSYEVELLTNEGGKVNHIHVGARYRGGGETPVGNMSPMQEAKAMRSGSTGGGSTGGGSSSGGGGGGSNAGGYGQQNVGTGIFDGVPIVGKGSKLSLPSQVDSVSGASQATAFQNLPKYRRVKVKKAKR